jgi:hypothetical protein
MLNAVVCILVLLGLSCCAVVFGLKCRRPDRDWSRPSPLATAGILLGTAAMISWITVGINLIVILAAFWGYDDHRRGLEWWPYQHVMTEICQRKQQGRRERDERCHDTGGMPRPTHQSPHRRARPLEAE